MSDQTLHVLIEGFDESKLQEDNQLEQDWQQIYSAVQNKLILQSELIGVEEHAGKTVGIVLIGQVRGILPLEFSGFTNIQQLRHKVGQKIAFHVVSYDRGNREAGETGSFVASRVSALEQMREITWNRLAEGQVILAVVNRVNRFGVRVDIGGINVVIPISEMDYGWIDNIHDLVKVGDHLRVKVMELDKENKKIKLSAKALKKNPWPDCAKRFVKNGEYLGKVSGVEEYAIFVNLEKGVDAKVPHLRYDKVKKGDKVLVRVYNVDVKKEEITGRIVTVYN